MKKKTASNASKPTKRRTSAPRTKKRFSMSRIRSTQPHPRPRRLAAGHRPDRGQHRARVHRPLPPHGTLLKAPMIMKTTNETRAIYNALRKVRPEPAWREPERMRPSEAIGMAVIWFAVLCGLAVRAARLL
jgi:hypothetical protein